MLSLEIKEKSEVNKKHKFTDKTSLFLMKLGEGHLCALQVVYTCGQKFWQQCKVSYVSMIYWGTIRIISQVSKVL